MPYRRCGRSGIRLPALSLGLWQNFGGRRPPEEARSLLLRAFDLGITHFDLANNYGPPYGSAEETFGRVMRSDLARHRDELLVSTKAGFDMWPGPYGDGGSRKYLLASLDQSLRRMGLDYVDIFYSHRPDPDTPLAETMGALASAVQAGKALYAGISNYPADRTAEAAALLRQLGAPLLIHQPSYSMLNRWVEDKLLDVLGSEGVGCIAFSPLAQGVLSGKYTADIPPASRAAENWTLTGSDLSHQVRGRVAGLAAIARERGQTLSQLAIAWALRDSRVTSALVGVRTSSQLEENVAAVSAPGLTTEELAAIERCLES
jgi:L-glyceraldehyde 3-phosphate reductase